VVSIPNTSIDLPLSNLRTFFCPCAIGQTGVSLIA